MSGSDFPSSAGIVAVHLGGAAALIIEAILVVRL